MPGIFSVPLPFPKDREIFATKVKGRKQQPPPPLIYILKIAQSVFNIQVTSQRVAMENDIIYYKIKDLWSKVKTHIPRFGSQVKGGGMRKERGIVKNIFFTKERRYFLWNPNDCSFIKMHKHQSQSSPIFQDNTLYPLPRHLSYSRLLFYNFFTSKEENIKCNQCKVCFNPPPPITVKYLKVTKTWIQGEQICHHYGGGGENSVRLFKLQTIFQHEHIYRPCPAKATIKRYQTRHRRNLMHIHTCLPLALAKARFDSSGRGGGCPKINSQPTRPFPFSRKMDTASSKPLLRNQPSPPPLIYNLRRGK